MPAHPRVCGESAFHRRKEITSVATKGSCVTMMRKTSAGSSGARRTHRCRAVVGAPVGVTHRSARWAARDGPTAVSVNGVAIVGPPLLLVQLADGLSQALTLVECALVRDLPGDRGTDRLRGACAEVGELWDVDELDADRRARLNAG